MQTGVISSLKNQKKDVDQMRKDTECGIGFEGWDEPGQGVMGLQHFERGLMWASTKLCGHMQPQFQPRASYRHLQWLLGKIESL